MPIIKLTKLNNVWNSKISKWESTENSILLFNTEMLITAEENRTGGTHVKYKEAMVNGFDCKETLEEFFNLCK